MKVGVVSDTHGWFDPTLRERFVGVDCILHAGDVDSQGVLDELAEIAPVHAVRGNVDPLTLDLPLSRKLRLEGELIEVQHILPLSQSQLEKWNKGARAGKIHPGPPESILKNFDGATRVVIFGHTHEPFLAAIGGVLFFNPGSGGKKRFSLPRCCGVLEMAAGGIGAVILSLGGKEEGLPRKVCLPSGE